MRCLIVLFLMVITQSLFAQENKFGLTVEYSPNYSGLTDEVVNEKFKISHNALVRILYQSEGKIKPALGLAFFNTGKVESSEIGGALGIESVQFIHNYNYLLVPVGIKINFGKVFILPEVGIGINLSNKTTQITEFTSGEYDKETKDEQLNIGEFNKITVPFFLSVGVDFSIANKSFSTGLKGYYGMNQVIKNVPRNNHYLGIGFILAMNL